MVKKYLRAACYLGGLVLLTLVGLFTWTQLRPAGPEPVEPVAGVPADLPVSMSRGEYLARAADCVACHTAKGGEPYAGNRPFHLPFGEIYATNLTPDRETGIGNWSDDQFVDAVRKGVGAEGHLYPAMPYTSYAAMSRNDVLEIKKYLMTLKPIHEPTKANDLAFPFNQRWGMAFWNLAFFRETRYVADASKSPEWNRGAYLAGALGHCGECHTPRNIGFAMQSRDFLSGAMIEGWKAYNTTQDDQYGIGSWTDAQLISYLSTGHAPGRSSAAGPMAEVVEHSLQYLSQSDIKALATYMRGITPGSGVADVSVNPSPTAASASSAVLPAGQSRTNSRGERLFASDCAGCHQWNGAGRQSQYASLTGSRAVNDTEGDALIQVMLHGTSIEIKGQKHVMPPFGSSYSDSDVAAVANYVVEHFGDKQGTVSAEAVRERRTQ